MFLGIMLIILSSFFGVIWLFSDGPLKHEMPWKASNSLSIVDSEMVPSICDSTQRIYILGRIKNESPYDWQYVGFYVELLDGDGKVIDNDSCVETEIVAKSHEETSFKIWTTPVRDISSYKGHRIEIRLADRMS